MNLDEAKILMQGCESVNSRLNDVAFIIDSIEDVEIKGKLRNALGVAMGEIYVSLMQSIVEKFPELDPDKESN